MTELRQRQTELSQEKELIKSQLERRAEEVQLYEQERGDMMVRIQVCCTQTLRRRHGVAVPRAAAGDGRHGALPDRRIKRPAPGRRRRPDRAPRRPLPSPLLAPDARRPGHGRRGGGGVGAGRPPPLNRGSSYGDEFATISWQDGAPLQRAV